ncbi:hypothetical protein GpartN1_g5453.t1 [Galdieria partita]|uniref:Uncharacterized protein n=1 Tax=Galdieria partita TaxID=83374 RepID=A0A9C7Q1W6_9RHOD|nr:hypothetical protein GpartN1_g5453.t1 [Galdieria partita]
MEENDDNCALFAEEAATLIAETLHVYDKIKELGGVNSSIDANLSSLLLTEGLDQLVAANLQERVDIYDGGRKIAFFDGADASSSQSTTVVTVPASANTHSSQASRSYQYNSEQDERTDFERVRTKEQESSHSVCSHNKVQDELVEIENSHNVQHRSSDNRHLLTHRRPEGFAKRKKERKLSRQSLTNMLRRMKEALNSMEERVVGCESEQLHNYKLENKDSLLTKRPKKEQNKYLPLMVNDSLFSEGRDKVATQRRESSTSISYATIENMSAQWLGNNNDTKESLLNELQSITKFFLRILKNDWKDVLPSGLNSDRLLDKSEWTSNELVHVLTMSIQFLCGRSAAISERESCLEAEMHRLEEFERQLDAREAAIMNKERSHFGGSMKISQRIQNGFETVGQLGNAPKSHLETFRKQNVAYFSIPASEMSNDSNSLNEDSPRVFSEPNRQLSDLRSRVCTAEHRLKKVCNRLRRSGKDRFSSTHSTPELSRSGYEEGSVSSCAESSIQRKDSMRKELEELRTELLQHYSTLQSSMTEALKSISNRLEEQRIQRPFAMDTEKLHRREGAVETSENHSMSMLRNIEGSSCCLDSPSLLDALSATEREWIRRLEVLKAIISQNGQLKGGLNGIDPKGTGETSGNVASTQKLNDFVLAFVRENEALDMYWKRALDSIPEQLERTCASETAFSDKFRLSDE